MACERGHTHFIVFTHACGYYFFGGPPGAATIRGAASIRINTVYATYALRRMRMHMKCEICLKALAPLLLCYSRAHHSIDYHEKIMLIGQNGPLER